MGADGGGFEVEFWVEPDGKSPILDWFDELGRRGEKLLAKALWLIELLETLGASLQAPHVKWNIYGPISELRARYRHHTIRIYFGRAGNKALVAVGELKKSSEPDPKLLDYAFQAYKAWADERKGEE